MYGCWCRGVACVLVGVSARADHQVRLLQTKVKSPCQQRASAGVRAAVCLGQRWRVGEEGLKPLRLEACKLVDATAQARARATARHGRNPQPSTLNCATRARRDGDATRLHWSTCCMHARCTCDEQMTRTSHEGGEQRAAQAWGFRACVTRAAGVSLQQNAREGGGGAPSGGGGGGHPLRP